MSSYKETEYKKNFNLSLWQSVLKQTLPHKRLIIVLAIVMVLNAAIDSILPLLTRYAIDHMIIPKKYDGMLTFISINVAAILLQFVLVFMLIDFAGRLETSMNFDLRKSCIRKLNQMSFSYYDRTPTGWIVARLTADISRLGDIVAWGIVDLVWGLAMIIMVTGIIFALNWQLAIIVVSLLPLMAWISTKFHIRILGSYRQVRKINSQITHGFGEGIHGAKTTKTLVREKANLDEFMSINQDMYRNSVKAAVTSALFMPIILMISSIGTGLVLWLGGSSVIAQVIGYGTLVAFISYTMQLYEPISNVARLFAELQNAQAAAERVFSLLQLVPEIDLSIPMTPEWSAKRMKGRITIQNMSFAYKEGKSVFSDFNLDIDPGESIALVGETGTGKTTLVNLICRFYEPQSGSIQIDEQDYRAIPIDWIHTQLGYVQQAPHLFQGSIMENIRYGKLDATDQEVIDAATAINAHDFIVHLPEQYDYKVGESGNLLSTGQKQLIAFARVILADPALLILDEATASIDTETEQLLQESIHKILQGRTSIIVAHRLSTIRGVDRILMLHKGAIIEQGNHQSLMRSKGDYYNLYMNQFMQEVADEEFAKDA
ncbi:MAG: ABC transporter ATP-binding protein [Candidatus Cloacimonetes bacterium HGW-Cloacimonetes-1]|nr:MAG: ABC transporter ATP-binding protein [Candidatus Cloacimonetes bacterium HGW-Cloacimonetes-1]